VRGAYEGVGRGRCRVCIGRVAVVVGRIVGRCGRGSERCVFGLKCVTECCARVGACGCLVAGAWKAAVEVG
jgi:hypothetical protein